MTTDASNRPDPRALRAAFGAFMTGVTVVATRDADGQPRGFTANSFTSVSLDPPLLLVCIGKTAGSFPVFDAADGFAVSVLSEGQHEVATAFASRTADRFGATAWTDGPLGHPVIEGAAAWFDCRTHDRVDAGDHVILIGEVAAFDTTGANGLGYAHGGFFTLGVSEKALRVAAGDAPVALGAIVERVDGDRVEIFLEPDGAGGWRPPLVEANGDADQIAALKSHLAELGLSATLGPLYAVFASPRSGRENIFYRAVCSRSAAPAGDGAFFDLDALPLASINGAAMGSMLRAYVEQHRSRRFNIRYGAGR